MRLYYKLKSPDGGEGDGRRIWVEGSMGEGGRGCGRGGVGGLPPKPLIPYAEIFDSIFNVIIIFAVNLLSIFFPVSSSL